MSKEKKTGPATEALSKVPPTPPQDKPDLNVAQKACLVKLQEVKAAAISAGLASLGEDVSRIIRIHFGR